MTSATVLSGTGTVLADELAGLIAAARPSALGVASAYLTLDGAQYIGELQRRHRIGTVAVIAGISGAVTHPAALQFLADTSVHVRLGTHDHGIFHPKLLVAGSRLDRSTGAVAAPSCGYLGSGNFTQYGLHRNLEVGLLSDAQPFVGRLAEHFAAIWTNAHALTPTRLADYEAVFRERLKKRSPEDVEALEMGQPESVERGRARRPGPPVVMPGAASTVWVGLESFTGEHTFQVEFPRDAGQVLTALLGTGDGTVDIESADGVTRQMRYAYYADNSMYRLNVPNDVPLVDWARQNRSGALVVSRDAAAQGGPRITAEIVRGRKLSDLRRKSVLLNTLGETPTREYGWF